MANTKTRTCIIHHNNFCLYNWLFSFVFFSFFFFNLISKYICFSICYYFFSLTCIKCPCATQHTSKNGHIFDRRIHKILNRCLNLYFIFICFGFVPIYSYMLLLLIPHY